MSYEREIINKLLDIYERRGAYKKELSEIRAITIKPSEQFPEYTNTYNHSAYQELNLAIELLLRQDLVAVKSTPRGSYEKVQLKLEKVPLAYEFVLRKPLSNKYLEIRKVLGEFQNSEYPLIKCFLQDLNRRVEDGKKLPYGIEYDATRLKQVLCVILAILQLRDETYVRNFSNALFKDSKIFQSDYRSTLQSILYDYTEAAVEKDRILEVYNLYENPTYILLKGNAHIRTENSSIHLQDLSGGIAIPEKALENITAIEVQSKTVITVENLTTFHDCPDGEELYIYLGGFHNSSKENMLKLIYAQNPDCSYFHKGDLDVYGFAILESLKMRTGIPFQPLEMDLATLQKYYHAGLYKKLTDADKKAMETVNLRQYSEIFKFMLANNCKVEQESIKALDLL